jgi:hypothetical protein
MLKQETLKSEILKEILKQVQNDIIQDLVQGDTKKKLCITHTPKIFCKRKG